MSIVLTFAQLIWSADISDSMNTQSKEGFRKIYILLQQERLQLAEKRLELNLRLLKWRLENHVETYNGVTSIERVEHENRDYAQEIKRLKIEVDSAKKWDLDSVQKMSAAKNIVETLDKLKLTALACQNELGQFKDPSDSIFLTDLVRRYSLASDSDKYLTSKELNENHFWIQAKNALELSYHTFLCERRLGSKISRHTPDASSIASCLVARIEHMTAERKISKLNTDIRIGLTLQVPEFMKNPNLAVTKYRTGFEEALIKFVESKSDYVVKPWDLLSEAILISNGQLSSALLASFIVLREKRTFLSFQRKLFDITGRRPMGSDNSGAWYHFFGTLLARLAYPGLIGDAMIGFTRYTWGGKGPLGLIGMGRDDEDDRFDMLGVDVMDNFLRNKNYDSLSCTYERIFKVQRQ